jgi:acylphosphatase
MKKSVRLYISGRVQGVFYRAFVKENAEKIGVKGFVRNLDDGRVEIFIEGNPEDVRKMMALVKKGPKNCEVKNIEEKEERFQDFKQFKVLHI